MKIRLHSALRISIIYFVFSAAWIFLSDRLLRLMFEDIDSFHQLSTIKGIVFIVVSSFIIYYLINHEIKLLKVARQNIERFKVYDTLTKLYNRDSFYKEIDHIYENKELVSIIISDINGLKVINEIYSSEEGDNVLKRYSDLLKKIMPDDAFVARIDGDEFGVIVHHCDYEKAKSYTDILLDEVSREYVKDLKCSVSIGYSSNCNEVHNVYDSLALAQDRMIKNKLLTAKSSSNSIIQSLKATMFEKSDETEAHASRIQDNCVMLGQKLNLTNTQLDDLKLLAILHDIGKIGIDDSILKKKGKLSEIEYSKMKQHPIIGYKLASAVHQLESIAYYILTHHEHYNGEGYPNGLKGEEIPLLSRILSICDAFDAMTNDRVYRKAISKEQAIEELIKYKATQFDPNLVDIFVNEVN